MHFAVDAQNQPAAFGAEGLVAQIGHGTLNHEVVAGRAVGHAIGYVVALADKRARLFGITGQHDLLPRRPGEAVVAEGYDLPLAVGIIFIPVDGTVGEADKGSPVVSFDCILVLRLCGQSVKRQQQYYQ